MQLANQLKSLQSAGVVEIERSSNSSLPETVYERGPAQNTDEPKSGSAMPAECRKPEKRTCIMLRLTQVVKSAGPKAKPEIGIQFGGGATSPAELQAEGTMDSSWAVQQAERFLEAGAYMIMIESEGITENVESRRTDVPAKFIGRLGLSKLMFEATDPQAFTGLGLAGRICPQFTHIVFRRPRLKLSNCGRVVSYPFIPSQRPEQFLCIMKNCFR